MSSFRGHCAVTLQGGTHKTSPLEYTIAWDSKQLIISLGFPLGIKIDFKIGFLIYEYTKFSIKRYTRVIKSHIRFPDIINRNVHHIYSSVVWRIPYQPGVSPFLDGGGIFMSTIWDTVWRLKLIKIQTYKTKPNICFKGWKGCLVLLRQCVQFNTLNYKSG